ncbi:MAG: hypothetical protein ACE5F1_18645 [Planctomycetota bacterium]
MKPENKKLVPALVFLGISVFVVLNAFLGGRKAASRDPSPPVLIQETKHDRPPVPSIDLLARHGSHDPGRTFPELFRPARDEGQKKGRSYR